MTRDNGRPPINVLSVYAESMAVSGPGKVLQNTLKGFDEVGQRYMVNGSLGSTHRVWVHCHEKAIVDLRALHCATLIGPNMAAFPWDLIPNPPRRRCALLHPASWVADVWRQEGYSELPMYVWPTGIDTQAWQPRNPPLRTLNREVLVYNKYRPPAELKYVCALLSKLNIAYRVLNCRDYTELEYREALTSCQFIIWLGRAETQGIALLEALASDVPVLVIEPSGLLHAEPLPKVIPKSLVSYKATSAPYFDRRCGVRIFAFAELESAIEDMYNRLDQFSPRTYVVQNLTLGSQALALSGLFDLLDAEACAATGPGGSYRPSVRATLESAIHRIRVNIEGRSAHRALRRRAVSSASSELAPLTAVE